MSSRVIELPYAPGAEPDAALRCGCLGDLGEQVDLWTFSLDAEAAPAGRDAALLSADEAARAARFRRELDRRRFIAGRAGLRRILAAYGQADPAGLAFSYGPSGKPELAGH